MGDEARHGGDHRAGDVVRCDVRAPQMLPEPVGAIGQWLPPGAGSTLLRSMAFFDGAGATGPAPTLTWWAVLGLGAVMLGDALKRRRTEDGRAPERKPALVG